MREQTSKESAEFIKQCFGNPENFLPLHEPRFIGNERKYVLDAIDSTFVSSVGKYVDEVEKVFAAYTGAKFAVACVNGTAALHLSLLVAGVKRDDLVITQPLSFIATCNAISYISAQPIFVDVDLNTMGLSANALDAYLGENAELREDGFCYHLLRNKRISACVPMHTFGHPCEIDAILDICNKYHIVLVEDAAESIGSYYKEQHTGTFGKVGAFSFNGNKTITCGGGGMIVTNDESVAKSAKHLSTQAKVPHKWDFVHDSIGYNYRMPNLNAAFLLAQIENLGPFLESKRALAQLYKSYFVQHGIKFMEEPQNAKSNYWLCAILLQDENCKIEFLTYLNDHGVMSRPIWKLMNKLEMFKNCETGLIPNSEYFERVLVNIPSSVIPA
jgi:perosamine synthetase